MADSLIKLMRKKPIEKITAAEITKNAGVGRATWFRNFTSKNEAITFKLIRLWERWADEHDLAERHYFTTDNAVSFFEFNYSIKKTINTIYGAGLQSAVYDAFYQVMMPPEAESAEDGYKCRFYSYGLFGLLDEWVRRDFRESAADMAEMILILFFG